MGATEATGSDADQLRPARATTLRIGRGPQPPRSLLRVSRVSRVSGLSWTERQLPSPPPLRLDPRATTVGRPLPSARSALLPLPPPRQRPPVWDRDRRHEDRCGRHRDSSRWARRSRLRQRPHSPRRLSRCRHRRRRRRRRRVRRVRVFNRLRVRREACRRTRCRSLCSCPATCLGASRTQLPLCERPRALASRTCFPPTGSTS